MKITDEQFADWVMETLTDTEIHHFSVLLYIEKRKDDCNCVQNANEKSFEKLCLAKRIWLNGFYDDFFHIDSSGLVSKIRSSFSEIKTYKSPILGVDTFHGSSAESFSWKYTNTELLLCNLLSIDIDCVKKSILSSYKYNGAWFTVRQFKVFATKIISGHTYNL